MWLTSTHLFELPLAITNKKTTPSLIRSFYSRLSIDSSSSSLPPISKRCTLVSRKSSSLARKQVCLVSSNQLEVEDDTEACELVYGSELRIGGGSDAIQAHLFKAVKNNNGAGILLLSDIFGFEDSFTRDIAYRVACNGYNVLVPDLFRGDPWSRERSRALFEQWLDKQDPSRVAEDIDISTKWMVDEFMVSENPRKLGIVGFCYGGGRLLEVLARDHNSTFGTGVSFYGTRIDKSAAHDVKVPVLLITGDDDPLCPVEVLNGLEKIIGNGSRVVVFKGRGHGFAHRPESPEEDEDAEEAFAITRNWLNEHLLRGD